MYQVSTFYPHHVHCLLSSFTVSTVQRITISHYIAPSSMCGGLSAKFGQQPPDGGGRGRRRKQVSPPPRRQRAVQNGNITVGCVGKDTVYTLYDLLPGRQYFVSVFGQYVNRSVSFQYGTKQFW